MVVPYCSMLLLRFPMQLNRVTCRTMDITDTQMQLSPAEFKYQNFLNKWNSVKCIADVDLRFNIPVTSEKSRFESLIFVSREIQHIASSKNEIFSGDML